MLLRPEDVEPAWQRAIAAGGGDTQPLLAETVMSRRAVALLTVRTDGPDGPALSSASRSAIARSTAACWSRRQPRQMSEARLGAA